MIDALTAESRMECPVHGTRRPTVICRHLREGSRAGFHVPDEPDAEMPWLRSAWCDRCEEVLEREGEWNDRSEAFASILFVCEGCFEDVRARNGVA